MPARPKLAISATSAVTIEPVLSEATRSALDINPAIVQALAKELQRATGRLVVRISIPAEHLPDGEIRIPLPSGSLIVQARR